MSAEGALARIRMLFDAAAGVPAPQRSDRLAQLGATEAEVAEVFAMLAAAEQDTAGLRAAAARSAPAPVAGDALPRPFGPFLLRREIGRGGMGVVYEAEEVATGEVVALKRIRGEGVQPTARERFLREARLGATVDDPHCVFVRSGGSVDGDLFLTMELLSGDNLRHLVERRGPLPIAEARERILEVCRGLEALHAADIVHRDLKPENCLLTDAGHVKVGDLGLSRTLAPMSLHLTGADQMLGTPAFAAPEQLRGDPVDVRADVYGATATLFFLLTGKPPFVGRDYAQLIARVIGDPVPSLREHGVAASTALDSLVQRGLAKVPAERFASIADLVAAIEAAMADRVQLAPLGQRLGAFVADWGLLFVAAAFASFTFDGFDLFACSWRSVWAGDPTWLFVLMAAVAYFALTEGLGGASFGKRLVGLRVVRTSDGARLGLARAAGRAGLVALVFSMNEPLADLLPAWFALLLPLAVIVSYGLPFLLLFPPARNWGRRGVHDRWFGTSVVVAAAVPSPRPAAKGASPVAAGLEGQTVEIDPVLGRQVLVVPAETDLHPEWSPRLVDRTRRDGRDVVLLAAPIGRSWADWLASGCGSWAESCDVLSALARTQAWQPCGPAQLVIGARGTLRVLPRAATMAPPATTGLADWARQVASARGFDIPWSVRRQILATTGPSDDQRLVAVLESARVQTTAVTGRQRYRCSLGSAVLFVALILVFYSIQFLPRVARVQVLSRGLQITETIQEVADGASTREAFAATLRQRGLEVEPTVAEAATVRARVERDLATRLRDGKRSLLLPFDPTDRELHELARATFFFAPREPKNHESLLRKWNDWLADRSDAQRFAALCQLLPLLFPLVAGLGAAMLGFLVRGRWPFRWAGLRLIDARGRDLTRWRAAWQASIVFVPVSLLVLLAEWADRAFEYGTLVCGLVYWTIFGAAILYPLLAFRMPRRMPHDVLAGTRVVAR